jgi:hypothetical protein
MFNVLEIIKYLVEINALLRTTKPMSKKRIIDTEELLENGMSFHEFTKPMARKRIKSKQSNLCTGNVLIL